VEKTTIDIKGISKIYLTKKGEVKALEDINLRIEPGEFLSIIGPSGCGKTTLLNIVAGFLTPTTGKVLVNGEEIRGPSPERGVIFQQYAVFPWLTVYENVEFGLKNKSNWLPKEEREKIVWKFIRLMGLQKFSDAYPKELSGGMKQRVAIARAYAVNPKIFLMDEPFGALDAQTRSFMQEALLKILSQERKTVMFITHSVDEAIFMSDRVIVMSAQPGRIKENLKIDIPRPRRPEHKASAKFVEYERIIESLVREEFFRIHKKEMKELLLNSVDEERDINERKTGNFRNEKKEE